MSVVVTWYVGVTVALACVLAVVICVQWVVDRVRGVQRGAAGAGTSETTLATATAAPSDDGVRLPRVDLRPPAERAGAAAGSGSGELLAAAGGGA